MKKIFCCPVLELFHCVPLWKTVLFVSSRVFSLSTPVRLHGKKLQNATNDIFTKSLKKQEGLKRLLGCSKNEPLLNCFSREEALSMVPSRNKLLKSAILKKDYHFWSIPTNVLPLLFFQGFSF